MSGVKFQAVQEFIYLFYTSRIWIYCYPNNIYFFDMEIAWHAETGKKQLF